MPNGDGTGPDGNGPRTGRGLGRSAGNKMGRGQRDGRGQGTLRDNSNRKYKNSKGGNYAKRR